MKWKRGKKRNEGAGNYENNLKNRRAREKRRRKAHRKGKKKVRKESQFLTTQYSFFERRGDGRNGIKRQTTRGEKGVRGGTTTRRDLCLLLSLKKRSFGRKAEKVGIRIKM